MKRNEIGVGLIGFGTVGAGTVQVLMHHADTIAAKVGVPVVLKRIADKDITTPRMVQVPDGLLTTDVSDVIDNPEIDIVVELVGGIGVAKQFIERALEAGKHVVTANKELMAKFGHSLLEEAGARHQDLMFEGAVGGGIPIISPLKTVLAANDIQRVVGIVNGTTNYILTRMADEGSTFEDALAEAQALGYAEVDPTADVEGHDAKYKAAILASISFNTQINIDDVWCEGITQVTSADMYWASQLGYVIKLLAIAQVTENGNVQVRVHPAMLPLTHPLANVRGVFNGILVYGDAVGQVMFYGPGAGGLATGSVVASDVMDIARNILFNATGRVGCTCFVRREMEPVAQIHTAYYVRQHVDDKPNVLAQVAGVLGANNISVSSVVQRPVAPGVAEIVWVTHQANEGTFQRALRELRRVPVVREIGSVLRVESV